MFSNGLRLETRPPETREETAVCAKQEKRQANYRSLAEAGVQGCRRCPMRSWAPAFAGERKRFERRPRLVEAA